MHALHMLHMLLLLLQGHRLMASIAADNCWLMASSILPQAWPAAAADAGLQARLSAAAAHITRQAMQQAMTTPHSSSSSSSILQESIAAAAAAAAAAAPHVQLLVVGGLGLQAMQLAAAASNVQSQLLKTPQQQQQQGAAVPSMALSFVPNDGLSAQLAAQLFADNDLDDIIDVCSWGELQQQQQQHDSSSSEGAAAEAVPAVACAALLAGVIQPNWGNAIAGCLSACRGISNLTDSSSSSSSNLCVLSPATIKVWAVPVSCKDLLNLNEVDLQEIVQHTSGSYDYAAANAALRRSSRPCQVSRFRPQLLADPVVVLQLKLQDMLHSLQQQQQQGEAEDAAAQSEAPVAAAAAEAAAALAAALCAGKSAAASTTAVPLHTSGNVDCIVWWLEFELAPGCFVNYATAAGSAGKAGSSSSSSRSGANQLDVLRPHVWQHVQYLPPQQQQQQQQQQMQGKQGSSSDLAAIVCQGQQATAGQQLLLQVNASPEQLSMSLFSSSSSSSSAAAADGGLQSVQEQLAQLRMQQQQQQQQQCAGQILPYHLSMLNDHARTRAYDKGIAAVVQDLLQQQQGEDSAAAVVLDVGCGTGLLSMMAATAAAAAGGADGKQKLQIVGEFASLLSSNNIRVLVCSPSQLHVLSACMVQQLGLWLVAGLGSRSVYCPLLISVFVRCLLHHATFTHCPTACPAYKCSMQT
jgi:hypothetical protein